MIKLSTTVRAPVPEEKLGSHAILCGIGSCFSTHILGHFFDLGLDGSQNPNGIVYNAVSMADALYHACHNVDYTATDCVAHNGKWHSWKHHGSFSNESIDELLETAHDKSAEFRTSLVRADLMVLTPSSSVVYEFDGKVTANCHRIPNHQFTRRVLTVEENVTALTKSISHIRQLNPDCLILFTLSPVRHYPGDLVLNARSKANLLAAMHQVLENTANASYFPSYEIILDELRGYRFYKEDMLHPNDLARKIVLQRFTDTYFTSGAISDLTQRAKVQIQQQHKPRIP